MDEDQATEVLVTGAISQEIPGEKRGEAVSQLSRTGMTMSEDAAMIASTQPADSNLTFTEKIARYQKQLEDEFQTFEATLAQQTPDAELESMDWDELERRYEHEMGEQIAAERDIMNDFSARFKQFTLWMQVSNEKESDRALKRLRTQMAFVQNSEGQLTAKQEHYAKVLGAFQDAMALLGNL